MPKSGGLLSFKVSGLVEVISRIAAKLKLNKALHSKPTKMKLAPALNVQTQHLLLQVSSLPKIFNAKKCLQNFASDSFIAIFLSKLKQV